MHPYAPKWALSPRSPPNCPEYPSRVRRPQKGPYYECSVTITSSINRVENDEQLVLVQKTVGQGFPNRSI